MTYRTWVQRATPAMCGVWLLVSSLMAAPGLVIAQWPRPWVRESCVLGWTRPTTNTDGTLLTDLDHFRVCVADTAGGSCIASYTVEIFVTEVTCGQMGLVIRSNPYFIRVYAVDTASLESPASANLEVLVWEGRTLMPVP